MKKLLLVILLAFTLIACGDTQENKQEKLEEDILMKYANDYIGGDIERFIVNIDKVEHVYHNGEKHPITKDGMYGTYYFIEYYFDMGYQDHVQNMIVKLWYETEEKKEVIDYDVIIV